MTNILKFSKPVVCIGSLLAALLTMGVAAADTGDTSGSLNSAAADVPSYQYSGWFFNPDTEPFPSVPDPSQQWTSAGNIDLINYWLSLVSDLGSNPSLAATPNGLGLNDSPAVAALDSSAQGQSSVPEPMALSLLGGGLLFLSFYAAGRTRRMR